MAKSIEPTKASSSDLTKERGGIPTQPALQQVTVWPTLGMDVADQLITTVSSVVDIIRIEAHRSAGSLIELSQTLSSNAAKAAQAVIDELNKASSSIIQLAAKSAHESIANTRATINALATSASEALSGNKAPVASA
jgi:hypothetical protein